MPVGSRHSPDTDTIDIGGHDFAQRRKWRDVKHNPRVAVDIDDIASVNPWRVRGIEMRGQAAVRMTGGETVVAESWSKRVVSWYNLLLFDSQAPNACGFNKHDVEHR